jgi:exonuclease SbcC
VKPLRLAVEGFTSFRQKVELDFAGLDLFAITGPTGAGKSSLIDAVVFALYGQVPRIGDDYKQLISHGAERLSVQLDFAVGGESYRIARTARPDRPSQQRLERVSPSGTQPIADRAKEIRAEVERLLGLDYDGFTRSVVLPQGQFDAFLKGEPKERRKILVALLSLGVYERMQQLANQRVAKARDEAEFVRRQLETDFAGATPEALQQAKARLCSVEQEAQRAERALSGLSEAAALAQRARAARGEADALARDEADEAQALAAAQSTLDGADRRRAELAGDADAVRRAHESLAFDESRFHALTAAKPRATQLAALAPRVSRATAELAAKQRSLDEARAELAAATAEAPALAAAAERAREQEATARAAREAAHRAHLAVALRRGLVAGEPCPVCAQAVGSVPEADAPQIEAAEARAREAEKTRQAASDRLQQQRVRLAQLEAAAAGLGRELAQLDAQQRDLRSLAAEAVSELLRAGFLEIETANADGLAARIASELSALDSARRQRAELETRRQSLEQQLAQLDGAFAAAGARRDAARARLAELAVRRAAAAERLESARRELLAQAAAEGWSGLEPLPRGRDEADLVEALRVSAQRASAEAAACLATARQAVARSEQDLARVEELRARRSELESRAALCRSLADHLKANELVAWIQEEALRRLALEGSRHLSRLSQGRYELRLGAGGADAAAKAEQDFCVVDHWNGESVRSVRTLSGGETFLASLALALALAESLAQLSVEGRARDALESLFLDEGFGSLDADSLDVVVSALDALHGGQRMVGIVTHVRELAERLPARLEVRRQGSASTAVVV